MTQAEKIAQYAANRLAEIGPAIERAIEESRTDEGALKITVTLTITPKKKRTYLRGVVAWKNVQRGELVDLADAVPAPAQSETST